MQPVGSEHKVWTKVCMISSDFTVHIILTVYNANIASWLYGLPFFGANNWALVYQL